IQRLKYAEYAEIRIGTGEDLFLRYVLPQAKEYAHKYPNVLFRAVASMSSESSIDGILQGDIDLGFLNIRPEHDSIGYERIGSLHEIFLAGDIYGAQLGTAPVTWEQLVQCPLLLHPKYTYTRRRLDDKVKSMGLVAIANFESGNTHVLMKMAAEDLGVALVTKETAQTHPIYDCLQVIKLVEPYTPREIYVAWNKEKKMNVYLRELIENVVQYSKT
ncbi:MAG: substrate-binding domain-containing protein, partial [Candidatus Limiplasma sp.]|nr:substrate-binding domain-containing protein [Candidatus Limiplasma sp.]